MSFADGLNSYIKRTKLGIDDAIIAINTEISTNIIDLTPVDTGRAKGNWIPTIGTSANGINDIDDKSGNTTKVKASIEARKSAKKVFFLTNNLKYIRPLEHGSSSQNPSGMVGLSLQQIKANIRREFNVT